MVVFSVHLAVQISANIFYKKNAQKIWKFQFDYNNIVKQRVRTSFTFFHDS